ncbi:MAG: glycoside hydrolase family 36 protein [Candidatus Coatesbacteria bacterium]
MRKKPPKPPAQPAESEPAAERPSGAGPAVPPAARKEYRFEIQEKQGTVAIVGPRGVLAYPKFWIGVELAQGEVFTSCQTGLSAGDGAWVSEVANGRLLLGLSLKRSVTPAGVLLQASVRNNGPEPLEIRQLRVAHAVTGADVTPWGPSAEWSLLRMGYATGGAHREDADTRNSSRVAFNGERVVTRSWGAAALRFGASPRGLVAGFVTAEFQMAWIDVRKDRHTVELAAVCETEGVSLPAGRSIVSETLYLGLHDDVRQGLAEYGALCARRAGVSLKPVPAGWGSADSLRRDDLSGPAVLRQAAWIAAHRRDLPLGVVRIEEGWAGAAGDWTDPAGGFPRGLAPVAAGIAQAGLVPGLSLAPFTAVASSKLFREHPDWMVKDETGKPLAWDVEWAEPREFWYGLDGSHPEVQDWLRELFQSLRRAGFRHFRLDWLFMGCLKGAHAEPVTRVRAYRLGLEAIREGAGDAYLLGVMGPYPPSAGLVDGMRVSHDVHPGQDRWGPLSAAFAEAQQRWWMHRTLWNNDPGAVVVRGTGDGAADEARTIATGAELSGGAIFAGDSLDDLPADRVALIRGALARRRDAAAVPVDVFDRDLPRVLSLPLGRRRFRVGVFNDTGEPRAFALDLEAFGLARARVWELDGEVRRALGVIRRRCLTPPVPPRGVRVLLVEGA